MRVCGLVLLALLGACTSATPLSKTGDGGSAGSGAAGSGAKDAAVDARVTDAASGSDGSMQRDAKVADDGSTDDGGDAGSVFEGDAGSICPAHGFDRFDRSCKTSCGPNGLVCNAVSELCVRREPVGPAIVYECRPVPTGCEARRDCACAGSALCTSGYNVCSDVAPNTIGCDCPLCQ